MSLSHRLRKIGNLEAIEIQGKPGGPLIIFCHGYGADASDLVSLSKVLKVPPGTTWLFPNGPLEVNIASHTKAQAWFEIDTLSMERARADGLFHDLSKSTPKGMKQARERLASLVAAKGVPWSHVVLGGFSQGAMLAVMTALDAPANPRGLILLSAGVIDQSSWKQKAPRRSGLPFYQSHGETDDLLPLESARNLEALLGSAGLRGSLQIFNGGHEIPQEVIAGTNQFLKKIFPLA